MSKNNGNINYEELIASYLAREISQDEVYLLENWVQEDSANRKLFIQQKRAWQLTQSPKNYDGQFDTDKAWNNIESELFGKDETVVENKTIQFKPIYRMAATIAAVVTIGYFIFYLVYSNGNQQLIASQSTLTETLADGTEVTLNKNSTLTFPKQFKENERRVKLEGDAFFNVTRNPDKSFIIESGEISVEVLGTSFYVNAKPDEAKIEVTVETGKVFVYSNEENKIELLAGDIGTFNKQNKSLSKASNTDSNFLSWKTRKIQFKNTSLGEVAAVLGKTYHVKVQLTDPGLEECRLTASFNNDSLQQVLKVIAETLDLEISTKNNIVYIGGNACL